MAPDVLEELGNAEGLEEVAGDAGSGELVAGAGEDEAGADDEAGHRTEGSHLREEIEGGAAGEAEIGDDEVDAGTFTLEVLHGFAEVARGEDPVAGVLEFAGHHLEEDGFILYTQEERRFGGSLSRGGDCLRGDFHVYTIGREGVRGLVNREGRSRNIPEVAWEKYVGRLRVITEAWHRLC